MKLTKRGRVWLVDFYVGGQRVRKSTGERDKAAARQKAAEIVSKRQAEAGRCDLTLEAALLDTYERVWSKQKSAAHVHRRIMKLTREYKSWTDMAVDKLDYAQLDYLAIAMEGTGSGPATVNRFLALISKALTEAVRYGKLDSRPQFPYRKEPRGRLRWITPEEEQKLLRGCDDLWDVADAYAMKALIAFLVDTGARLSEVLTCCRFMNMERVTFDDTKNGGTRSVPLTARAKLVLPYIPMWSRQTAVSRFTRLRDHCNMPDVSLHTLRHTCASRLVQGGMDLYRVQTWLGHTSMATTQRYAHLSTTNLTEGVGILDSWKGAESTG